MKCKEPKAKSEMIPCPACGALTYGYMKEDHAFCRSCNCDLTEAAKKYVELVKKVREAQEKLAAEKKAVAEGKDINFAEDVDKLDAIVEAREEPTSEA